MTIKSIKNRFFKRFLLFNLIVGTMILFSCNALEHNERGEHDEEGEHNESSERGEHSRDTGEDGEGEEDGTQLGLSDTYDVTKHGVRLIIKYDKASNSFKGTMENTTNKKIKRARVEVHLSNGTELGPTKPITLAAKAKKEVVLQATEKSFEGWSTHAEIGDNEHGHSEEGEGHDREGEGEHR